MKLENFSDGRGSLPLPPFKAFPLHALQSAPVQRYTVNRSNMNRHLLPRPQFLLFPTRTTFIKSWWRHCVLQLWCVSTGISKVSFTNISYKSVLHTKFGTHSFFSTFSPILSQVSLQHEQKVKEIMTWRNTLSINFIIMTLLKEKYSAWS